MLDHFERSDGLGAIYPAMLVGVRYLAQDDPQVTRAVMSLSAWASTARTARPSTRRRTFSDAALLFPVGIPRRCFRH